MVAHFWALDDFKHAQFWDAHGGDWTLGPVQASNIPPPHRAKQAFMQAMDQWDEAAADAAVVGFVRAAEPQHVFDMLCRYGARDFRDIGHKAIYVANGWRTLHTIGWQHAEPVLRSLAYALLAYEGTNPAQRDAAVDRPFRQNQQRMSRLEQPPEPSPSALPAAAPHAERAPPAAGSSRAATGSGAQNSVVE